MATDTTFNVTLRQSVIIALLHAASVAGIVYATQRAQIHANSEATIRNEQALEIHANDNTRHGNSELISYQLRSLQSELSQVKELLRNNAP